MSFWVPVGATLVQPLGEGGVFELAIVQFAGQECICKRLRRRMLDEPAAQLAIEREAQVLSLLAHPAVPRLLEQGTDEWGAYLVETCLPGVTLRELVDGYRERGSAVPGGVLERLAREAFRVLTELHAARGPEGPLDWVHGDLSPDQVLVGQSGELYLVDFGQARWRGMATPAASERGTLPFVSPEVARSEVTPDQAGDVFALAATLAFVALGSDPCRAESTPARLVEVAERGVDIQALRQALAGRDRLLGALVAALQFERPRRLTEARAVLERLSPEVAQTK